MQSVTGRRGCNGMKVGGLMPGRPDGVIAVRKMVRKMKDTLPDVLSTIIRKEDGFQGGKLKRHPVTKRPRRCPCSSCTSWIILGMRQASSEVEKRIFRELLIRRRSGCAKKERGRT